MIAPGPRRSALALLLALAVPGPTLDAPGYRTVITGAILHATSVEVLGLVLRDVVAEPRLDGDVLRFANCSAKAYGGTVAGDIEVDLRHTVEAGNQGLYSGAIELAGWDLSAVARALGAGSDVGGGTVSGWFEWSIPGNRRDRLVGRGELRISDATLVQFPLLANLLVGDPVPQRGKDRLEARFEVRNDRIHVVAARLDSPGARIGIRGSISLDGELRLLVSPHFTWGLVERIPGPGALMAGWLSDVSGRLARTAVRGHFTKPVLAPNPFAEVE